MYVYSVYDQISGIYGNPFTAPSDAVAVRSFNATLTAVLENQSFQTFPYDSKLYCLGSFDANIGLITPFEKPSFVANFTPVNYERLASEASQNETEG